MQPGIIPRVVKVSIGLSLLAGRLTTSKDLFQRTGAITDAQVSVSISYMEIYKEDAYDLLVERESVSGNTTGTIR